MFDQFKELIAMSQQAKKLQAELSSERVIGKSRDGRFSITMNGNQEILDVFVPNVSLVKVEVEEGIKEAFHDAHSKIESLLRTKMGGPILGT